MAGPVPADFKAPRRLTLQEEPHRVVIYGAPDVGKTTLAATWPRPFFIDTDHNLISIAVAGYEPMVFAPNKYEDFEPLLWWAKERRGDFDTFVVDSVPTLQSLMLNEVHDLGVIHDTKQGKTIDPMMKFVPQQGEHLAQQKQLERILHNLGQFRKHIVLTAGVQEDGALRRPQMSPGNYNNLMQYWPSLMGELVVVTHHPKTGEEFPKPKRYLITESPLHATKAKFDSLKPGVWDPTYDKIKQKIDAEFAAAKAAQTKEKSA